MRADRPGGAAGEGAGTDGAGKERTAGDDLSAEAVFRDDGMCFVCGPKNPIGLKLQFTLTPERTLETTFIPEKIHQGYANVVHGGIVATVLDEVMVNLPNRLGQRAVTGRLSVSLKKPAMVGQPLFFQARIVRETRRTIEANATARREDGTLVAEAAGTLMKIPSR
jgi:uncharacterized protein (TIGR00369 family)